MKTEIDIANDVAHHLAAAERSHTLASRDQALLIASILDAGFSARVALKVDQRLVENAINGLTAQIAARRSQLELHNALAAVAILRGHDPQAFGESGGYAAKPELQVVKAATAA